MRCFLQASVASENCTEDGIIYLILDCLIVYFMTSYLLSVINLC